LIQIKGAPSDGFFIMVPSDKEDAMSMLKVIEVLAESEKSWEDAAQSAITRASKTVHNIRSIYIENLEATVESGRIAKYRINAKISFILD
jgi:flavin-binding protein dodecin